MSLLNMGNLLDRFNCAKAKFQILFYMFFSDTNECILNPFICLNGGTCINTEGDYYCECADGWGGKNCDEGNTNLYQFYL